MPRFDRTRRTIRAVFAKNTAGKAFAEKIAIKLGKPKPWEKIRIMRLDKEMPLPTRSKPGDAGLDLRSTKSTRIFVEGQQVVGTGIVIAVPKGFVGRILDRSGLAAEQGLHVIAGVIDSGYRGEVKVVLRNFGNKVVEINRGDRIAQIVFESIHTGEVVEVQSMEETIRGSSGFGNSGKK